MRADKLNSIGNNLQGPFDGQDREVPFIRDIHSGASTLNVDIHHSVEVRALIRHIGKFHSFN
ncbi:hypothetical protein MTR_6g086190 [Medicago truncatula]|uniref:Uncharacterized protein n=1 Tax=Medicago truncatula TaxID=3880 RepID=G7KNH0_MEDTR|nr:hypothetical protein MTR_6g086190 [Medicago truncatula]